MSDSPRPRSARAAKATATATGERALSRGGSVRRVDSHLTFKQKKQLHEAWLRLGGGGLDRLVALTCRRVFERSAEARRLVNCADGTLDQLQLDEGFRAQKKQFVELVGVVLAGADDGSAAAARLVQLGRETARRVQFGQQLWDVLGEALTESAVELTAPTTRGHRGCAHSWMLLVAFVVEQMRFGYDLEARARRHADANTAD